MRPFESLTVAGRVARVRRLGYSVVERFGLTGARLSLAGESFNTLFRVRTSGRDDCLLRVGPALRLHPAGSGEVEAAWLSALGEDTDIPIASVFRDLAGDAVTEASDPGVPEPRSCMLFSWIPGRVISGGLDNKVASDWGRLLAALHLHAETWRHPDDLNVPVANRVLYWNDEPRFEDLAPRYRSLFLEATARAQEMIDSLWASPPHRPHVLHGDFTPNNLVRTRRGLAPIDFQDLMIGFDVQDVATSLLSLQRRASTASLAQAFREGYATLRAWPENLAENREALFAARRLLMANLSLNIRKPGLDEYIDYMVTRLDAWMRPG
jgi:Ser/Thr protein kinase RdoA (MazF antagonist)